MRVPVVYQPPAAKVPFAIKLLYGIGEMPITVAMVLFGLFVLFFYNSVMGLPAPLVGAAIAAGLAVDAVLDPYVGYRSDRSRNRLGRRHGFMLLGAAAMGPCFWLLLSPPRGMGPAALFAWLLAGSLLFRTASAVYRIPYLSLGAELAQDYDERTRVIAIRSLFGLLGTLCAAGLSFLHFFPAVADGSDPKLQYAGYPRLGLAFGAVMTISGLVACLGTLRYGHLASIAAPASGAGAFVAGFRSCMRNPAFRSVWCSFTLFFMAVVLNATLAVHYFTWYVGLREGKLLSGVQSAFYLGAVAGVVFWMIMAKRGEKRNLYIIATLVTAGLLCCGTLLFGPGRLFGTGNALPLIAGHALAGIFASALWVLPGSMLADVADQDELETGLRREGSFFGILNLGEKLAAGGAVLLAGLLLHSFVGLRQGSPEQSKTVVERIGLLYGLLPGILLIVAAGLVLRYSLTREKVQTIQGQLADQKGEPAHA